MVLAVLALKFIEMVHLWIVQVAQAKGDLSTQGTRTNFLIANRDNSTSLGM